MDTWRYSVLALLLLVSAEAQQEKWIWDGKAGKVVRNGDGARYGVFDPEGSDDPYGRELRPPLVRPVPPPNHPPSPPDSDPTHFEKCKCVHAFNCKSPGLLFGSCDTGKKYCCEKTIHQGRKDFHPNNDYPEVLAGPGGPVDHIKKPIDRPDRPGLGSFGERPLRNGGYGPIPVRPLGQGSYGTRPERPLGQGSYGPIPERPLGQGSYIPIPERPLGQGSYGPGADVPLGSYGSRPNRRPGGSYGIRPDGSLGALDNGNFARPNIQRS